MEYTSDFTRLCPDLKVTTNTLGLWNFNDSSNAIIAIDSSVNAYNADIYGAIGEFDEICPPVTYTNVRDFDGIDDYIDLGDSVVAGVRTIEMWFKPAKEINSALKDFSKLAAREISGTNNTNEFNLAFAKPSIYGITGTIQFVIRNSNNVRYSVNSDTSVWNANQWYHIAAVIDSVKGMMLFIDGKKQSDTNTYSTAIVYHADYTAIGRWGKYTNGRYFEGSIDDVHFSSEAIYTFNFIPPCPDIKATSNTLGLWNFNDSSNATVARDSSNNSYDAYIYGAKGDTATICIPITTGIITNQMIADELVIVYPNPSSGVFVFDILEPTKSEDFEINIYSYTGKLIERRTISDKVNFDLTIHSDGIYFYILTIGSETYSGKLIKQ